MVEVGQEAPDFTLRSQDGEQITLSQYRGEKNVVLSVHVSSFTSGWADQVSGFRRRYRRFQEMDTQVLGISVDSSPAQRAFCTSLGNIPYPVLADFHPKGHVSQLYGVYNEERGVSRRSIFIIDKQGMVRYKQVYERGIPDEDEVLAEVAKLG